MSFSQKKKRSILPMAGGFIEEEFILETQKPRANKSLLDFKSPKLNRLKNFIKSPVQKSYNKYKQFQDNDDENSSTENKSVLENPNKRQSVDSQNIDISNESTINHESKDISQTSLLTTISTVPPDSYPISPCFDSLPSVINEMLPATNLSFSAKSVKSEYSNANISSAAEIADMNYRSKCGSLKESLHHTRPIIKSASIGVLCDPKNSGSLTDLDENESLDKVDGPNDKVVILSVDNKTSRWNPTIVDIETTEIMLQSLDEHIKNRKEKIFKELSVKEQMVDKLITNFSTNPDTKYSKKICKEFEVKNKTAEKVLEKSQLELEQLEFKRQIVSQDGIPWGVEPADYVKNINKKYKSKTKTTTVPEVKQSPSSISKFIKNVTQKSASAENISRLVNENKSLDNDFNKTWLIKAESLHKSKDFMSKTKIPDDSSKLVLSLEATNSSKVITLVHNLKKPGSAGANSAKSFDQQYGDKTSITKKSKSNSMSSGTGKEHNPENVEFHESPKNYGILDDDHFLMRFQSMQTEINLLTCEIQQVRDDFNGLERDTDNLRLDMNTNSDLNSQKMQNSIERVDRLERMLDLLRQQCQIEFITWKDEFRGLEEKLDYRMTTTRRDLQDNIDSCNNSISLVEKRTEQLPFISNRAGKSDVKVITDHLLNLIVSLIAFIMLLMSSGFHLLIKFLNIGATIGRHRNTLLPPLIIATALIIVSIKWSLWNKICTILTDSGYLPSYIATDL